MSTRSATEAEIFALMQQFIASSVLTNERIARSLGLNVVDLQALGIVARAGEPVSTGEVSTLTELPTSTTTRVLDRLEQHGFIRREQHPQDRRRVVVVVVPDAVQDLGTGTPADPYRPVIEAAQTVHEQFTAAELTTVARYFEASLRAAAQIPNDAESA